VLDRSSGEGDHVSAQLKVVRPDSPPLSQARTALRHANEALAAARDEAAAAAAAYNRLAAPTTMLAGVEAQHAALKVEHDGAIVAWYEAGAVGDRPALPDELEELERRIGQLRSDGAANETALERAQEAVQHASARMATWAVGIRRMPTVRPARSASSMASSTRRPPP
jgi:hypothetical protein